MNVTLFSLAPAAMRVPHDKCTLPDAVVKIAQQFGTHNMLDVETMPDGYVGCQGYGSKVYDGDWSAILKLYPGIIILITYCALVPFISAFWCIYHALRTTSPHFETVRGLHIRLFLTWLLVLLLIPMIFFLWLTFMSYWARPMAADEDSAMWPTSKSKLQKLYDNYDDIADHVLTKNIKEMQEYMMALPNEFVGLMLKSLGDLDASVSLKFHQIGNILQPIIAAINEDMEFLLNDVIQLIDYTRIYYNNTTIYLNKSGLNMSKHNEVMRNVMLANADKIKMLLNINQVFHNMDETINISAGIMELHHAVHQCIRELHDKFSQFMQESWKSSVFEFDKCLFEMNNAIKDLRGEEVYGLNIYLPTYINILALVFCFIVAALILLLTIFLIFAVIARRGVENKIAIKLAIIIIWMICLVILLLGMVGALHFIFGALIHNFKHSTLEAKSCIIDAAPYCNAYDQLLHLTQSHIEEEKASERHNMTSRMLYQVYNRYARVANIGTDNSSRVLELLAEVEHSNSVFRSGATFELFKSEFNMHDLFEHQERLTEWLTAASGQQLAPLHRQLIICNLNTMQHSVFQQLLAKNIVNRVNRLTRAARSLAAQLPDELDRLMEQVLQDVREMQYFYGKRFEDVLRDAAEYMLTMYATEMLSFLEILTDVPNCDTIKFMRLGITVDFYTCLEVTVHGFWWGAFATVLMLLPILIICMCLVPMLERLTWLPAHSTISNVTESRSAAGQSHVRWNNTAIESRSQILIAPRPARTRIPPRRPSVRERARPNTDNEPMHTARAGPVTEGEKMRRLVRNVLENTEADV